MKKYLVSVLAVVALLASACSKEDTKSPVAEEPQAQTGKFVFDVQVGTPETKAVKTGWEVGDEFIVFFNNDVTLGHTLTLTYNGTKWIGQFADQEFAEEFVAGKTGYCCGFSAQEASDITSLNNELRISAGGVVIFANATTYNITEEGDALHFNADFSTYYGTRHQFTITGISTDDGVWRLEGGYRTVVDGNIYGGDIDGVAPIFFDGSRVGRYSQDYVIGVANADGVAFNGDSDYDANGDLVLKLTNTTTGKVYYRIIPEGRIPSLNYTDAKAYKLAFSSFTEQTEATGLVRDADYHYYRTVVLKDGKEWMADNYRYVPEGKEITPIATSYTGSEGYGIWYPALFQLVEGETVTSSVTPSLSPKVIGAQGLLYTAAVALNGETIPTTDFEDCASTQGICPDGWHIPTGTEWLNLVGHCSNTARNNTAAHYYDSSVSGAALTALNADGLNILPYPYINGGKTYNAPFLNKTTTSTFYGYCSMEYYHSSTGRSATQTYAIMVTNNANYQRAQLGYNNLANGCPIRCVKD